MNNMDEVIKAIYRSLKVIEERLGALEEAFLYLKEEVDYEKKRDHQRSLPMLKRDEGSITSSSKETGL